jgi:hypothetical protein
MFEEIEKGTLVVHRAGLLYLFNIDNTFEENYQF